MTKFVKPMFKKEELDSQKTNMYVGYENSELIPGYDFTEKPKTLFQQKILNIKEKMNGIDKARYNHSEINKFGYATFYPEKNEIWFGVKYSCPNGLNTIASYVLEKYYQLLEYYLHDSGWKNIQQDNFSRSFIIKTDDIDNIQRLYTLSSSIGFYYKSVRPNLMYFERTKAYIKESKSNKLYLQNKKEYTR